MAHETDLLTEDAQNFHPPIFGIKGIHGTIPPETEDGTEFEPLPEPPTPPQTPS